MLRLSVILVAVFSFLWSLFFVVKDHLIMYSSLAMAVYMAGAGAVLIGGLYWKRGTTAGAWSAFTVGMITSLLSLILKTYWEHIPVLAELL